MAENMQATGLGVDDHLSTADLFFSDQVVGAPLAQSLFCTVPHRSLALLLRSSALPHPEK